MINTVEISRQAEKQIEKAPKHVSIKLLAWVEAVEETGLEEVRKVPGYRDHALKGKLKGKRAIALSRKWRAVYEVKVRDEAPQVVEFVELQEVHAHDY